MGEAGVVWGGVRIRAVVSDVDGVLTDGCIHATSEGAIFRSFHVRDGIGQKALVGAGVPVAWLSASRERESVLGRARMVGLDASLVDVGEGDKGPRLERLCGVLGVSAGEVLYVGDDVNDLPAMELAGARACPGDAHRRVREWVASAGGVVLETVGGRGVLREVADRLLEGRG